MPWIVTTVTKHSREIQKIARIPCDEVFKSIREDVDRALKSAEQMRPLKISPPIDLKIERKLKYSIFNYFKRLLNRQGSFENRFKVKSLSELVDNGIL
jgi:D-aminopeptidase